MSSTGGADSVVEGRLRDGVGRLFWRNMENLFLALLLESGDRSLSNQEIDELLAELCGLVTGCAISDDSYVRMRK